MNSILSIVAVYLAALTFGSMALMPFLDHNALKKSWARFYYGMIVIFFSLFLLTLQRLSYLNVNHFGIYLLAAWVWMLTFTKSFEKVEHYLYYLLGGVGFIWGLLFFKNYNTVQESYFNFVYKFSGFALLSIFLSAYLMTMILGHWYLINRSLPMVHLIKATKFLLGLSLLKVTFSSIDVYLAYTTLSEFEWHKISSFMGHGIFFWSRLLAGLGIPLLVSVLSYQSAKIGSNQSATGILYAGTAFVLMGEFLSLYLYSITGYLF